MLHSDMQALIVLQLTTDTIDVAGTRPVEAFFVD